MSTILITGANGMVGKTLVNQLQKETDTLLTPTSQELDLRNQQAVEDYFEKNNIDFVYHLAAKVGGIKANMESPVEFLEDNLRIGMNIISTAYKFKVKKLLNLGSSCIYPKECPQPMTPDMLLTNKLEPTNEGYAFGKITTLKLVEFYNSQYGTNYLNLMPCNLYGPYDHFDSEKSHVIPALISRMKRAIENNDSEFLVWGSGIAKREFLFTEDLVDAMIYFMNKYDAKDFKDPFINIGVGNDITIKDLVLTLKETMGFTGEITFDTTKPDGMLKKCLDVGVAKSMGWQAKTSFAQGLKKTIEYYEKIR